MLQKNYDIDNTGGGNPKVGSSPPKQWRSKEAPRRPTYGSKFSQFYAFFFFKFDKIVCYRPPPGLAPPPTGNPGSAPENCVKLKKNRIGTCL